MTPEDGPTLRAWAQERSSVERVLEVVDGIRGLFGGILVLVIVVASFSAGGTAGRALGGWLLGLLGVGALLAIRRRRA
jgi:MYXO-CTERM domain-containing protein